MKFNFLLSIISIALHAAAGKGLPQPWTSTPPIGVDAAWVHPARPGHLITVVRQTSEAPMSFKGVSEETIASGIIAYRKATLEQLGFRSWQAKVFRHTRSGDTDVIFMSGEYIRPDGQAMQFLELQKSKGRRFVQVSYMAESTQPGAVDADAEALIKNLLEGERL